MLDHQFRAKTKDASHSSQLSVIFDPGWLKKMPYVEPLTPLNTTSWQFSLRFYQDASACPFFWTVPWSSLPGCRVCSPNFHKVQMNNNHIEAANAGGVQDRWPEERLGAGRSARECVRWVKGEESARLYEWTGVKILIHYIPQQPRGRLQEDWFRAITFGLHHP